MSQPTIITPQVKAIQVRLWSVVFHNPLFTAEEAGRTFDSLSECFEETRLLRWEAGVLRVAQQRAQALCCPTCGGDGGEHRGCPSCGGVGMLPPAHID